MVAPALEATILCVVEAPTPLQRIYHPHNATRASKGLNGDR